MRWGIQRSPPVYQTFLKSSCSASSLCLFKSPQKLWFILTMVPSQLYQHNWYFKFLSDHWHLSNFWAPSAASVVIKLSWWFSWRVPSSLGHQHIAKSSRGWAEGKIKDVRGGGKSLHGRQHPSRGLGLAGAGREGFPCLSVNKKSIAWDICHYLSHDAKMVAISRHFPRSHTSDSFPASVTFLCLLPSSSLTAPDHHSLHWEWQLRHV